MSDLQCAARLLFLSVTDGAAAGWLPGERVARVYDGQHEVASAKAVALAETLNVQARALEERVSAGDVRAHAPAAMRVLRDVADLHRGETVVILTATEAPFEVRIDGDGVLVEPLARRA